MTTTEEWGSGGAAAALEQKTIRLKSLAMTRTCPDCGADTAFVATHGGKPLRVDVAKFDSQPAEFIIDARDKVYVTPAVMRHTCAAPVAERETFRKVADILAAHPDLQPIYDATRESIRGAVLDRDKVADAKAKWLAALDERGIDFKPMSASLGFPRFNEPDLDQRIGGAENEPEHGAHFMAEQNRAVI